MAKIVTCDETFESSLKQLKYTSEQATTSFIIGCRISEKHYHLISLLSLNGKNNDLGQLISTSLPGGIVVLGLALGVISTTEIKSKLFHLQTSLATIWKSSCCGIKEWVELGGASHQFVAYYSLESRKIRCMSADMTVSQSSLQMPGSEVKTSSISLIKLDAMLNFNTCKVVKASNEQLGISRLLKQSTRVCIDAILESICTINGHLPTENDLLTSFLSKEKSNLLIDFYCKLKSINEENPEVITDSYQLNITEGIQCKAYVHQSVSCTDAINALRLDAVKSITIRQNALLSEITDNDLSMKKFKLIYPRRVWFRDNTKCFPLTDYCFPNETEMELLENLKSIWGQNLEIFSEESKEVVKLEIPTKIQTMKQAKTSKSTIWQHYYIFSILIVILLSILIYYYTNN